MLNFDPARQPSAPGVYLMKDARGTALYVGKAKNLRKRLRSYLKAERDGRAQIRFLLERAVAVETIVTDTEKEALLLEDTLIKEHRPRYNIDLRGQDLYLPAARFARGVPGLRGRPPGAPAHAHPPRQRWWRSTEEPRVR